MYVPELSQIRSFGDKRDRENHGMCARDTGHKGLVPDVACRGFAHVKFSAEMLRSVHFLNKNDIETTSRGEELNHGEAT